MRIRGFWIVSRLALLVPLLVAPSPGPCCRAAGADPPNIVLCMADDQGWGDVGYRDHPVLKTPVMDVLARTALHFERFYAAAPVCSPTRGSVMTGRHPNRFACFSWGHPLRAQEITIAEALKQSGYTTGHFGKWHLGSVSLNSSCSPGASGFDEWLSSPNFYENDPLMSHNGTVIQTAGESSVVAAEAAIRFMRAAVRQGDPFLAVVWFGSPHGPHIATDQFRRPYEHLPKKEAEFYGELAGMDFAIGMLRDELRQLNVRDNTVFWYNSDNGVLPVGSAAGLSERKGRLGEGGIRVPAMIEWPARIKQGRTVTVPCSTLDIYPTLLDIVGVAVPQQVKPLDGISLVDLIDGNMTRRPKPLGFWVHPTRGIGTRSTAILEQLRDQQTGRSQSPPLPPIYAATRDRVYPKTELPGPAAWIDNDFKLRLIRRGNDDRVALYNLADDPAETKDLAQQYPARVKQMRAALESWQKSVVDSLNGRDY